MTVAPTARAMPGGERVLALVTDAFGGYGGIAQYNRDFVTALAKLPQVQRIVVLTRLAPSPLEPLPNKVHQPAALFGRWRYTVAALFQALRTRPTVVFCGHIYHGPLARVLARLVGAKLVSQLHGTEVWGPVARWQLRALESSDLVLTVSRDTRARLLAKADIAPERVQVLNNTVGDQYTPGDRQRARAKFSVGDEFVVLTVARLDAREGYKGHDRIIPLVAECKRMGRTVTYLIAGIGADRQRLESLATEQGVGEQVRFLGKVANADLPDLYRAADLFALPSTGEGFGIAFLEAMACGTPALGLAVGGAPDALGDGQLGLCLAENDLKRGFEEALKHQGQNRPDLSIETKGRFGWDSFVVRMAQVFRQS